MAKVPMATVYRALYDRRKDDIEAWIKDAPESARNHFPLEFSEFQAILRGSEVLVHPPTIRDKWEIAVEQKVIELRQGSKIRGMVYLPGLFTKLKVPMPSRVCECMCVCVCDETSEEVSE